MDTDKLKEKAGKYGKVSKRGLYSGLGLGRLSGGYLGLQAGEAVFSEAEIAEIYPHIDPGQLGPEETAIYAALLSGYVLGGLGVAKGVTKYQEMREKDIKYTRPFLKPAEGLEKVREYLESEDEEESLKEAFELVFDEDDKDR